MYDFSRQLDAKLYAAMSLRPIRCPVLAQYHEPNLMHPRTQQAELSKPENTADRETIDDQAARSCCAMTLSTLTSERTNEHPPLKGGTNLSRVRYYSNTSVRSRIEEFFGFANRSDKHPSCFFMAIRHSEKTQYLNRFAKRWLPSRANDLLEISRSLWDRESLLADLDIEYVNFDFRAEPFL